MPPQAVINATMSWSTSGPTDALTVEADGVGSVALNALPQNNGMFAITVENDKPTFHFLSSAPLPSGANTSIELTRPLTATPNTTTTTTGVLTWRRLPQEFVFHLNTTQRDGEPITLSFNGSQNMQPNPNFTVQFDYITNGLLAGRLTQSAFGAQLSTSVTLNRDAGNNINGVVVNSTPGAVSNVVLSAYRAGALSAVVQLGALPADTSETTVQLKGTVTEASGGVTISGTNAPTYIGAASYMVGTATSPTPQASMILTRGATPAGLPFALSDGAVLSLRVKEVARTFKIEIRAKGTGGVVTGVDTSGSTTSSTRTADQLVLQAKLDAVRRIVLLMNQLGDSWAFNGNVRGQASAPTGVEITDTNVTPVPNEYKQVALFTNGAVSHSLIVQRPVSDLTGAIPPAGIQAQVFDPPPSFDVTIDYTSPRLVGVVCEQVLQFYGENSAASNGWVKLINGAVTIDVERLFVQGDWRVNVTATGGVDCQPKKFAFEMRQGIGPNPAGKVTVNAAGLGQIAIRSFSKAHTVTVELLPGSDGKPSGVRIDATNSEENPGSQILLLHLNAGVIQSAVNIWTASAGPITYGTNTAVLANTPQNFGIEFQKITDAVTGGEAARVVSHNQAPAPAETLQLIVPAGDALPGGSLRLTIRSLDVGTVVQLSVAAAAAGTIHAHLVSQNANANLTEVVSAVLVNGAGTPQYNILLHRPNADLTGIPMGAARASAVWERMPQSFDLQAKLVVNGANRKFEMDLKNSQANANGTLRIHQPSDNLSLTFGGTGAAQTFTVSTASASLHVNGSAPAGMGYVQIARLRGTTEDTLLTVYRSGSPAVWSTDRGTEVWIQPSATMTAYNATIGVQTRGASFTGGGDVVGNRIVVAQYYQMGGTEPCIWSGSRLPCTDIQLDNMPREANLTMALGDKEHPAPTIDYSASESGLSLRVNALVPGLGGYMTFSGLPKAGITFTATIVPNSGGITATVASKDAAEPLPYFYVYGWNVKLPLHVDAPITKSLGWGATFNALMSIHFNYNAYITIQGDPGLTSVVVTSPTVGEGKDARWAGLLGVKASGNPNARFNFGVSMDLDPGSHGLAWDWEITEGNLLVIDQDWNSFSWYNPYSTPLGFSDVGLSSYAWEAKKGDSRRFAAYGCSALNTTPPVVNDDDKLAAGTAKPFSPSFVRVNSGLLVCGGHTAYYQVNINDLLFKHNGYWGPGCCGDNWSYAHLPFPLNDDTDWLMAVALKNIYNQDPSGLTAVD